MAKSRFLGLLQVDLGWAGGPMVGLILHAGFHYGFFILQTTWFCFKMEHFESLFNSTYNGGFKVKHVLGKKSMAGISGQFESWENDNLRTTMLDSLYQASK